MEVELEHMTQSFALLYIGKSVYYIENIVY